MRILILGNGGREHAFAWKIKQSPLCTELYIAPGNAGTEMQGQNLQVPLNDFNAIKKAVIDKEIQMVIVGPEEPLVKGIYDFFQQDDQLRNIPIIGPSRDAAQLEGSKDFAKTFMKEQNIPTAGYRSFTKLEMEAGKAYIKQHTLPVVLKADGLAAGKGVIICDKHESAISEFESLLSGKFGAASETVVVEQFLSGIEFSVFVLTDGNNYQVLPIAKDYKRVGPGDTGPNTGGMGAISPVPFVDDTLLEKVRSRIIEPTLAGLQKKNYIYKGFIFLGLILVEDEPYVIEYNCRMGDPETQVVLPRLENDLVELLLATSNGTLGAHAIKISDKTAAAVIMVSGGYPGDYEKGKVITGLYEAIESMVFHAGTTTADDGHIVTNGGRVLAITSLGEDIESATATSYRHLTKIDFEGKYFRPDIGFDLKQFQ